MRVTCGEGIVPGLLVEALRIMEQADDDNDNDDDNDDDDGDDGKT